MTDDTDDIIDAIRYATECYIDVGTWPMDTTSGDTITLDLDLSGLESDDLPDSVGIDDLREKYEGSFEIELPTETVVCPHCGEVTEVLSALSSKLTGSADSCKECGFPL